MSRTCDICNKSALEYMTVTAWWSKYLEYEDPYEKHNRWSVQLRQDISGLTADVCRQCVDEQLSKFMHFHREFSEKLLQERAIEKRRKQYPNEAMLKSLRMTIPNGLEDVFCDICNTSCFEKHLKFRSEWQYPDQSTLVAYICEQCVSRHSLNFADTICGEILS